MKQITTQIQFGGVTKLQRGLKALLDGDGEWLTAGEKHRNILCILYIAYES